MHQTTTKIDHQYPVPRALHPTPHLSHTPVQMSQCSDTDATIRDGLQQGNFFAPHLSSTHHDPQGGLAQK